MSNRNYASDNMNSYSTASSTGGHHEGGRLGTWVMGIPANPSTHPVNQQAANWVAQDSAPSSPYTRNPTGQHQQQQQYMHYSGFPAPVTGTVTYYDQDMPPQRNAYVQTTPAPGSSGKTPLDMIASVCNKWGKMLDDSLRNAEGFAGNVWNHLRTGPSLADTARGRIAQGTKVLTEGGYEKVFRQTFETIPGEQLRKSYACYLSTSTGPVIGTLYVSTMKLAFCSDSPLAYTRYPGQTEWNNYKVVVPLSQLRAVNPSANRFNPTEKYIQVITADNHEFWFMGFVTYDKALKILQEAVRDQASQMSTS